MQEAPSASEFSPIKLEMAEPHASLADFGRSRCWTRWLAAACLVLAAVVGFRAADSLRSGDRFTVAEAPIEDIRVGQRVYVDTAHAEQDVTFGGEIDPEMWRHAQFLMSKPDGGRTRINLLRPAVWFNSLGAAVGRTVYLSLPEMDVEGGAEVLSLGPCPEIPDGLGYVVTGTFAHESDDVLSLHVAGVAGPLGVTRTHLMYSADRQTFVPAGELREGERLNLRRGPAPITGIEDRPGTHRVYNLEVHVAHVYHVTGAGVLVHNTCPDPDIIPYDILQLRQKIAARQASLRRGVGSDLDEIADYVYEFEQLKRLQERYRRWAQGGMAFPPDGP